LEKNNKNTVGSSSVQLPHHEIIMTTNGSKLPNGHIAKISMLKFPVNQNYL